MTWEWVVGFFIGCAGGAYLSGYVKERLDQRRQARLVDAEAAAARHMAAVLAATEQAQYVGLDGVEKGALRQYPIERFMRPPLTDTVVMVGSRNECEFVTQLLGLNPNRVLIAAYPWQVDTSVDVDRDVRVIILSSAYALPQIGAIVDNVYRLSDARFVRLVI